MAIIKKKELKAMSKEELEAKEKEIRSEMMRELGAARSGTKPENPGKIREMRRTIARIKTVMRGAAQ